MARGGYDRTYQHICSFMMRERVDEGEDEVKRRPFKPSLEEPDIDHGWAWVILIAAASWNALIAGSMRSFGVIYVEYLELFQQGAVATGWIGAVFALFVTILAPISGYVGDHLSATSLRRVVAICGVVIAGGVAASGWAPSLPFAILFYGVIAGIATAVADSPILTLIAKFFRKRRFLATGVLCAGGSVGTLVIPPVFTLLNEAYGIRGAMLVLAALWLHTCAIGATISPVTLWRALVDHDQPPEHAPGNVAGCQGKCDPVHLQCSSSSISRKSPGSRPVVMAMDISTTPKQASGGNILEDSGTTHTGRTPTDVHIQEASAMNVDNNTDVHSSVAHSRERERTKKKSSSIEDDVSNVPLAGERAKSNDDKRRRKEIGGHSSSMFRDYFLFLRTPGLLSLMFTFFFASFAFFGTFFLFPSLAQELGFSKLVGSLLVSVPNISELISRIGAGQLIDRGLINKTKLLYSSFVLSFGLGIAVSFSTHAWVFIAFAAVFGLLSGIFAIMMIPMMVEVVAVDKMGSATGLYPFLTGVGIFLGPPVLAAVREATGSWRWSLRLCTSSYLCAFVCLFVNNSLLLERHCCTRR